MEVYQPCAALVMRNDYELFTLLLQRGWSGANECGLTMQSYVFLGAIFPMA
jgi:hypothetical protein